ncbi:P-loop containing nucleoside triphosphate hydrolase protein [Auricularia subglabra TFB-10046 SS5]|nr:P-loop containing nucleoside triphosphate hydrolase protein [Auricularia subglabra TFB-10046 SS5]
MHGPSSALAVDTTTHDPHALYSPSTPSMTSSSPAPPTPLPTLPYAPPQPSIRLLYSFLTRRDLLACIFPAVVASVAAGGVAPFMTVVIGQAFQVFSQFPSASEASEQDKRDLLHGVGVASLELLLLAVGSFALTATMSALWIWSGERNVMRIRKRVYEAVTTREMVWFDTKLGGDDPDAAIDAPSEEHLGPAGLMAKFAKDTDDVRAASSLAMGQLVQFLVTFITALILAFKASWSLTLVILATVPVTVLIQGLSQAFSGPLLERERTSFSAAGNVISRAVASIATVKAFNGAQYEATSVGKHFETLRDVVVRTSALWGFTTAVSQFSLLSMFVQGFWFGSYLMRKGQLTFGEVVSVFWACLIAASNFQMAIPLLITLARGKWAMVSLVTLIKPPPTDFPKPSPRSSLNMPLSPGTPHRTFIPVARRGSAAVALRKIRPATAPEGEIVLRDVTFSYPTRPDHPAILGVSMFIPAKEMTFIVGPSGSGKSTIAQLLLRMYEPNMGTIDFDDQSLEFLDEEFTKEHVAAVAQGCVLFDMTVHENVAMGLAGVPGRSPQDATRDEVSDACRIALVHEFVRDLPEGYETKLGNGGANLSGGQKQRLAIARAKLRDPTVLILDEATSALDPTSRHLVFEAIRSWRKGKTTLVVTHDLGLIEPADFVYVMKDGEVAEQGYREDLEDANTSLWKEMRQFSNTVREPAAYGWAPEVVIDTASEIDAVLDEAEQVNTEKRARHASKHASVLTIGAALRPASQWMLDAIADITRSEQQPPLPHNEKTAPSAWLAEPYDRYTKHASMKMNRRATRPSSIAIPSLTIPETARESTFHARRSSLQFTPTSPTFFQIEDDKDFDLEKSAMALSGTTASQRREFIKPPRQRWDKPVVEVKVEKKSRFPRRKADKKPEIPHDEQRASLIQVARVFWPTVPNKGMIVLGVLAALISGAMTPIFSFLFSKLLIATANVKTQGTAEITRTALFVLLVAFGDGFFAGLKYFIMEVAGFKWIDSLRRKCFPTVLLQDKKWFDEPANSAERLMHTFMKDGDDARALIVTVLAQAVLVFSMISVGFIWALIQGWQLTLAGLAIGPVFALVMTVQARLISHFELRNKRAREEVARRYHDAIANIREIRSMAFESVFKEQYDDAVDRALRSGTRGGFAEGGTVGVASALIYVAEALLFYVGAILIAKGEYTYLQMMQVLNLVAFTVTIASQLLAFVERIAKAVQAAHDFSRIVNLRTDTDESHGSLRPPIRGSIAFNNVTFAYPQRSDAPVLRGLNMQFNEGESVAIVGSSGSGKSTIAALLQRLYEPSSGSITVGGNPVSETDVVWLREHVAVVSQSPHLFDASVSDNISYGNRPVPPVDIVRAAREAHIHDFIATLPRGYETNIGENAALVSGGQAQRIQIARALVRSAHVLILDECTSALDPASESAVMDTLRHVKRGRTTLMITHKVPIMRMCDRIVVVQDGQVVEQGSYDELMARRRAFFKLASAGEWA